LSVDAALAAAILSTDRNQALDADALFLGEIGLTGEIRAISFPEIRIKEAMKLGFKQFYLPAYNQKHFEDPGLLKKNRVVFLKSVHDLAKSI
jgi:DNA repair protein RadA/Sms